MRFDLAAQVQRPSRRPITLPPITTTKAQADDLAKLYLRIVQHWQAAIEVITGTYERTIEQSLQTDTAEEIGGTVNSVSSQLQRILVLLTPDLRDWALRTEKWHRGKWARGVLSAAGVDISTQIGPQDERETIAAFLERNTALIRDVSEQTRGRISDAVFRGLQQRTPAREVAKEITEAIGMARRRARNIAADQTVKLASALDAERQRQAGLTHWKWRSSHKQHFRPEHRARDGKVYTDETAPKDLPGMLPYCGCTRQGVIMLEGDDAPAPVKPPKRLQVREDSPRAYVLKKGKETGNEHLVARNANGEVIARVEGRRDSVDFTPDLVRAVSDPNNSITLYHNHPRSTSLSLPDIRVMVRNQGVRAIWAHGHNGSDFGAEAGELPFSEDIYQAVHGAIRQVLQGLINGGVVTTDDASLLHQHLALTVQQKQQRLRYTATLKGSSREAYDRNAALYERILDAFE